MELSLSVEILNDPAKRTYVDTRLETDRRRKEKYAQSDKKRKEMIDVRPVPLMGVHCSLDQSCTLPRYCSRESVQATRRS